MTRLINRVPSGRKHEYPYLWSLIAVQKRWPVFFFQPVSATIYYIDAMSGFLLAVACQ